MVKLVPYESCVVVECSIGQFSCQKKFCFFIYSLRILETLYNRTNPSISISDSDELVSASSIFKGKSHECAVCYDSTCHGKRFLLRVLCRKTWLACAATPASRLTPCLNLTLPLLVRNSQPFLSLEQLAFDKDRAAFTSNILSLILHLLQLYGSVYFDS